MFLWKKFFVRRCTAICVLGILVALIGICLGHLHFLLDACSHFRVQIAGGVLGFSLVLIVLRRRSWFSWVAFACGLALLGSLAPFFLPPSEDPRAGGIRVLTFNVLTSNPEHSRVIDYLSERDADVVVLQEIDRHWEAALQAALVERYPYHLTQSRADNFGIGVWSKLPLLPGSSIRDIGRQEVPSVDVCVQQGEDVWRIIGTHPLPPISTTYWRARNAQLTALAEEVVAEDRLAVVCGDLNVTPWSPIYRQFSQRSGLRNASLGQGIHFTWTPYPFPFQIPIDHILHSDGIAVAEYGVGPDLGSDHRPVEAVLTRTK